MNDHRPDPYDHGATRRIDSAPTPRQDYRPQDNYRDTYYDEQPAHDSYAAAADEDYTTGPGDSPVTQYQKVSEELQEAREENAKLRPYRIVAFIAVPAALVLLIIAIVIGANSHTNSDPVAPGKASTVVGPGGVSTVVQTQTETKTATETATQTETSTATETKTDTSTKTTTVTVPDADKPDQGDSGNAADQDGR